MEGIISETYCNSTIFYPENIDPEILSKFKKFIDYYNQYMIAFGLTQWYNEFYLIEDSEDPQYKASVEYNMPNYMVFVRVGELFLKSYPEEDIEKCAFHEACEILLAQASVLLDSVYSKEYTEEVLHDIIRRLENYVFSRQ